MKPIRHRMRVASLTRWVFLAALAFAASSQSARAQSFDYGFGEIGSTSPYELYGSPPSYDYVSYPGVYGYGDIDFGYGPQVTSYGDSYSGYGSNSGYVNGNLAFGGGGPVIANPVLDEGQNAAGNQGRAKEKKAPRRGQAKAVKPAGAEAARKP